jgi:hypothetical protein
MYNFWDIQKIVPVQKIAQDFFACECFHKFRGPGADCGGNVSRETFPGKRSRL